MKWYFKKCTDFSGRASRADYWSFVLFNTIPAYVILLIAGLTPLAYYWPYVCTLALLIPPLAVGVRRLHDVGKSGWMYLIALIPIVGWIWLIVLFCTDSQKGSNKWGDNPKGSEI